ncbi:MAG TPA: succinic semialdehyde dehydrogenase [Candidatus Binatia bacterium]|nr:succinic semialdehyde dehydrogenase [Candidatus Binatia bacterium]
MAQGAPTVERPPDRGTVVVRNPATGERIAQYPAADREAVEAAVARARRAQPGWAALSFAERARMLRRLRDLLVDRKDRIAEVVSGETGKPRHDVLTNELLIVCDGIGFWGRRAARWLADEPARPHLMLNKRAYVSYRPHGVVGIIGPWNFPFSLTIGEAIPALMAGNGVVIKPSEVTPQSALFGCELAVEAGLPPGILQAVVGYGDAGTHLVDLADMICFTGSVETGRKVAARCGQLLKPVTLELGGKDPMLVLRDADLERAANACVYGALANAGQVCISVERVYVEAPVYDAFVAKVVEKVRQVRQGVPDGSPMEVGAMTFPPQIEKVERHVRDAVARGARVLAGGRRRSDLPGLFYEPTVLVDVTHEMEVMRDETFGPVIPIMRVADAEEAVRLANDSRYGLDASVWTRDRARGARVARRIESGAVCVNDVMVNFAVPEIPMGGVKESGIGHRHGPEGIRKFCAQQAVVIDRFGMKREVNWWPITPGKLRLFRRVIDLFGSGWRRKLLGRG